MRAGVVESLHLVNAAVVSDTGKHAGQARGRGLGDRLRSAAKPFQAIPLVDDGVVDGFGITRGGAGSGGRLPQRGARSTSRGVAAILEKVGFGADALEAGSDRHLFARRPRRPSTDRDGA